MNDISELTADAVDFTLSRIEEVFGKNTFRRAKEVLDNIDTSLLKNNEILPLVILEMEMVFAIKRREKYTPISQKFHPNFVHVSTKMRNEMAELNHKIEEIVAIRDACPPIEVIAKVKHNNKILPFRIL